MQNSFFLLLFSQKRRIDHKTNKILPKMTLNEFEIEFAPNLKYIKID